MMAAKAAKDEAQRIEATAVAAAKKVTLMDMFSTLRGSWAVRAKEQLEKEMDIVDAVKKLQRAARVQVSAASDEPQQ